MMQKEEPLVCSVTSPAAPGTAIHPLKGGDLGRASKVVIDATLTQPTGGNLDVYIQRRLGTDAWADVVHFPQLVPGSTTFRYTTTLNGEGTGLTAVGGGTDAAPGVGLAVNTVVNCLPGSELRVILVAAASTSAGAVQVIRATPFVERG